MREMKDSGIPWIGKVPSNWLVEPIFSDFVEVTRKNKFGREKKALKFTYGEIVPKANFDADNDNYVADTILNYTIVEPGTIMLNGLNLNYDFISQRIGLVKQKGVITSAYTAFKPINMQKISSKYSTYLFKAYDNCKAFHNMGGGVRKILNFKELSKQPFIHPPIGEQRRIADYLDTKCARIDSIRKNVEAEIEALKQYKQSVITEAVTKGLDKNVEMKDSGIPWIGKIPKEWETPQLIFMCTMKAGDNLISNEIQQNGNYPVYGGNGIRGYYYRYNISTKVILVGRQGALAGNIHYIQKRIWATEHAIITKPINNVQIKYLFYLLKAMNLNQYAYLTAAQPGLAVNVILHKNGILPSLNEQRQIANYLDTKCSKIDSIIQKKQELLANLDTYKKSLIYEYVTGKKEVPAV